jgi:hypothetical protein
MAFNEFKIGVVRNPLVRSVFVEEFRSTNVAPGISQFIDTEDDKDLETENSVLLTTEG